MSKKKRDGIKVSFVGQNSESVTGSCTLVEYNDIKILLECGLYQSNNLKKDYQVNAKSLKFRAKDIDYIFLMHTHIDHIGLVPRLYSEKECCNAKIITTEKTASFLEVMLKDSAYIMSRDSATLSRRLEKEVQPLYIEKDVDRAIECVEGYPTNEMVKLDDNISFRFINSGHIIGASQLELYIKKDSGHIEKILYTSDLGNLKLQKPYVENFEPCTKASIVIGETTYGSADRLIKKKDRDKDIEKLKTVVIDTCIERNGRVLIPSFSLDRTQFVLTLLYELFGQDESFDIPVIVDSPLSCKISDIYRKVLVGEDRELFNKVCNWKNVKFVESAEVSKEIVANKSPKIIISSSGMLTAGRAVHYTQSILPDSNSTIMFIGFSSENSLAYKIKNGNTQKTIAINGKAIKNRCKIVDLRSFSSHMQKDDLLNYYSNIQTNTIYLVHGEMNGKLEFAKDLKEELSRKNKTTKVCVVNKSTIATI